MTPPAEETDARTPDHPAPSLDRLDTVRHLSRLGAGTSGGAKTRGRERGRQFRKPEFRPLIGRLTDRRIPDLKDVAAARPSHAARTAAYQGPRF
ncbi:MAG: hypothetical protein L6455_15255 [Kiritimatiellae bacterium]|nr:hypothetical protein [Kiritimatiellia bacterium]